MVIDCERCDARGLACGDCVIGVLLGVPEVPSVAADGIEPAAGRPSGASAVHLDAPERRALAVLADQGLVPQLRLVSTRMRSVTNSDHDGGNVRDAG